MRLCLNRVEPCEVAKMQSTNFWTSQFCSLPFYRFSGCEHPFIDKLLVRTEPVVPGHGFKVWVRNCIQAPSSACSTKILLDSRRVSLEYTKIEHVDKVTKLQGNVNHV